MIIDILKRGSEFTDSGIELILQPQSDIPLVREYLFSIGYMICEEKTIDGTDKKGYGCGMHEPNPMITHPAD